MNITWIRDKLKHFSVMLKHNEPAFITLEMIDEYVENQNVLVGALQSELAKTKTDLLESYKAIVEAKIITLQTGSEYCRFCKEDWRNHNSSCIVPKAEKIIKELDNDKKTN